ncbi:hypothetical protein Tco_0383618 [Tanacetum coccineum]
MWESAKTVAPTPNYFIIRPDVDDNFVINRTHLKMIQENKFDGYHGLYETTQAILDGTAGGIFLYKTPNQAFQYLEDKSLKEEMHEMRKKYNNRGGNPISKNYDTPMCERLEENYIQSEELEIQEMVNILVSREAYDKVFNHLDMLHAPLEGKSSQPAQSSQNEPKNLKNYKGEYKKMKATLALLEVSPSTSQSSKPFQPKNKGLVAKIFNWDEEEVLDDEEMTQVKVLMALADDELSVGKNHARNSEWIDITIRKVNILLSMDEDVDWQTYLKYINVDQKFVEEQRLNLLSKYNKIVFELNKCRDDLLVLKQAKLDDVTFQIQNTELTKLNHALQEQLKEEIKVNENWLISSKKVSQCISEQIPNKKKKILGGELLTESSSKGNVKENPCHTSTPWIKIKK